MENKDEKKLKIKIFVLSLIIVIIIIIIMYLSKKNEEIKSNNNYNLLEENVSLNQENSFLNNVINESDIDSSEIDNNIINSDTSQNNEIAKLSTVYSIKEYFLIKQFMKNYYDSYEVIRNRMDVASEYDKQNVFYLIDNEAIEDLKINENNISSFFENSLFSKFSIDEVYKQNIDGNKVLYVVYYRIEVESGIKNQVMFIKIDNKNKTFSIYPYQYLEKHNYTNLVENDSVNIGNTEIEKNSNNRVKTDNISYNALDCTKELFEKYKFDLYYDLEHLYDKINKEYKQMYFESIDEFKNYIEQNKDILVVDELSKYSTSNNGNYIEYTGTGESSRNYVFNVKSMTNYDIKLDDYSIESPSYLNGYQYALYGVRGGYCIDRVILAINEKNYKFVYKKLNTAQKSNYYPQYDLFEQFIKENFYEKNKFEIQGKEKYLSQEVYEFKIKVTNMNDVREEKTFIMVVHLKDKGDFEISIVKS